VESVINEANAEATKVVACFCGHHHLDRYALKSGVHYVWINSISYNWVGEQYGRMAAYRDPLYAFVTFRADGSIEIEGRQSEWVPPSPAERGYPGSNRLATYISDRKLSRPRE